MEEKRSVNRQILLCVTAYLTAIAPSMSIGFSAVSLPSMTDPENIRRLTIYQASWVASIASIGTPLGCLLSGPVSDRCGRRAGLLLVNVTAFAGWVLITLAPSLPHAPSSLYTLLLFGRFLTGFSTGLVSMPATVYMAEAASDGLRLLFTTASAVAYSSGIMGVYILGYLMPTNWSTVALISANIACFSMICGIFFLPESPIWLVSHNKINEAKESLRRIYGFKNITPLIERDLQTLINNRNKTNSKTSEDFNTKKIDRDICHHLRKKYQNLSKPECKKPLVIMTVYFFFQQFSGTFVIIFYAVRIVKITGASIDPFLGMLLIGLARFFTAILTCFISGRFGRRPPSLFSGVGMTITMATLAIYVYCTSGQSTSNTYGFIPISCLVLFIIVSTLGFVTVPFAMSAEVFPVKARGVASGLVSTSAYVFNFIVVKLFDFMLETIGVSGLFGFFACAAFVGTLFIYKWLPETRGKSMLEIEQYFKDGRRVDDVEESAPLNKS